MDQFYFYLKVATIGLGFPLGIMYLYIYFRTRQHKFHLYFGLIGIFAALLFSTYRESYYLHLLSWPAKIPVLFNLASFAVLPWFIGSYTGYGLKWFRIAISTGIAAVYLLVLVVGRDGDNTAPYVLPANLCNLANFFYVFAGGIHLYRSNKRRKGVLLLITGLSMLFLMLIGLNALYHQNSNSDYFSSHYYPVSFFPLFFMIIMGTEMTDDIVTRMLLENKLARQEKNWATLLNEVHHLAFVCTEDGRIIDGNKGFWTVIGQDRQRAANQVLFAGDLFKNSVEAEQFAAFIKNGNPNRNFENRLITGSSEEKIINWSKILLEDDSDQHILICIGKDITELKKVTDDLKKTAGELASARKMMEQESPILLENTDSLHPGPIIGESPGIKYVMMRIQQVAQADTTVLLEGETGVGKEVFARYLHELSSRSSRRLFTINCAAIPATLIESELFGHERGAFTGADRLKKGKFEAADNSTLFLDEVGELPMELQAKLLRVLQENEFERLGGNQPVKVNVRIIAATNRSLKKETEAGKFRPDLYYRLNIFPITIPPLRQRQQDIPLLATFFVKKFAEKHKKPIGQIPAYLIDQLINYDWPGNVRELQNILEQSVITCTGTTLKLSPLSSEQLRAISPTHQEKVNDQVLTLEESERIHILKALKKTSWRISGEHGAAQLLDINPSTLRSRMTKLGITKEK